MVGARPQSPRSEHLVVLIPGAETAVSFVPLAGILQGWWQVAILDSGFNEPRGILANLQYANLLHDFQEIAKGRSVILVGQGYGAVLASLLASDPRVQRAGVSISRMIWLSPSWSLREPASRLLTAGLRFLRRVPGGHRLLDLIERVEIRSLLLEIAEKRFPAGVPLDWYRSREKWQRRTTDENRLLPRHILWDVIPAETIVELLDNTALAISALDRIRCKVDVLWGTFDPVVRPVWLRWLLGRRLGRVQWLACGHFINLACPHAVAALVERAAVE
jgi:pimeloyl-ACP methyl ester carboxylesterase